MSDTTITLRGRIGTDLRVSKSANNHLTVRFRLAVTHWFASADGVLTQGRTQWYSVHAWDRLADNALHSLAKGEPVIVMGRPRANAWKDSDGNIRSEVVINAQAIGHDLTSGRSTWRKSMPSPSGGGSALSSGGERRAADRERRRTCPQRARLTGPLRAVRRRPRQHGPGTMPVRRRRAARHLE